MCEISTRGELETEVTCYMHSFRRIFNSVHNMYLVIDDPRVDKITASSKQTGPEM